MSELDTHTVFGIDVSLPSHWKGGDAKHSIKQKRTHEYKCVKREKIILKKGYVFKFGNS